jgi:hypothetical protein
MKMARSPSNKGLNKNNFNGSSRSIGRNPGGMVAGLTAGTTFGEGKEIKEQVAATGGLPKVTDLPQPQAPRQSMPQMDVFAGTQRPSEPVTAGLPFGPGISPPATNQVLQAEEIRNFVYDSWLETGDDSLLEFL